MSDLDQEIGKRLRKARKSCGYKSARAFAIEQHIPESTYSQHETGKRSLSPETVLRYCECLGMEAGWLLTGLNKASTDLLSEATAVPEAKLNASVRAGNQQIKSTSANKIRDDLVSINMDIFRGALSKTIHKFFDVKTTNVNVNELVEYCVDLYKGIAAMSSDYKSTDADQSISP